ncbi:MAG TPA: CHRD domain-containing protein [Candidatus Krumholzibacteria bacterium]|nr:CHRD domain-containing protein [Candidatus Krumholzibacteria bacterium]HPD73108.1 CHRD domain-containing protein [Candidatus Krumholzibacteria bacterium]HRY41908.1 CHRD domain-containing protein [Candidatus Krumholzibacteria bacterium]
MNSCENVHSRQMARDGLRIPPRPLPIVLLALAILPTAAESAQIVQYPVLLSGNQEVPAVTSAAFGGGKIVIDTAANTLSYEIVFGALSAGETAAHIHGPADPGQNAGVAVALPAGNPKIGVWNYQEAQEADILAGRMYVNVHSSTFPGGEIRGQITTTAALLDGDQEVPPVATSGQGAGVFHVNPETNELKYYIAFSGLGSAETAAHIHGAALHGTSAGVLYPLPLGNPKIGVINYAEADEQAILTGRTYVNIHSMLYPGGEIRGQIVPQVVPINGTQEVPPSGSAGAGIGMVSIGSATNELSFNIWVTGLSGAETAAHIHGFAPRGVNAGVLFPLQVGAKKLGVWDFGAGSRASILDGLTYINVHSNAFPGGEIRGQIDGFENLVVTDVAETPSTLFLAQNTPNPFNPATTIRFHLPQSGNAELVVYDLKGQRVHTLVDGRQESGDHEAVWRGDDESGQAMPSGIYVARLRAGGSLEAQKLTLVR